MAAAGDAAFYPHGLQSMSAATHPASAGPAVVARLGVPVARDMPTPSAFVRPQALFYTLDGRQRRWDMVSSHASVGVILYHVERRASAYLQK